MTQSEHNAAVIQELQEIKRYTLLGSKRVLNVDEAAIITGLSKSRIYTLTSQNKIPYHKSPEGRALYFERGELEEWMLSRHNTTEDEIKQIAATYTQKKRIGIN